MVTKRMGQCRTGRRPKVVAYGSAECLLSPGKRPLLFATRLPTVRSGRAQPKLLAFFSCHLAIVSKTKNALEGSFQTRVAHQSCPIRNGGDSILIVFFLLHRSAMPRNSRSSGVISAPWVSRKTIFMVSITAGGSGAAGCSSVPLHSAGTSIFSAFIRVGMLLIAALFWMVDDDGTVGHQS